MVKKHAAFILLLAVFSLLSPLLLNVEPVKAAGWLSGWSYRKSHVINPATGAGTNYPIRITAHYGNGTDSGEHVYLYSKCRSDFGDVRFTKSDGTTLLNYWMESKVDGDNAVFWVQIADDLSANPVTIYIYFGNPTVTTTSNGEAVFPDIFFDGESYASGTVNPDSWTNVYAWSSGDGGTIERGVTTEQAYGGTKSYILRITSFNNLYRDGYMNLYRVKSSVSGTYRLAGKIYVDAVSSSQYGATAGFIVLFYSSAVGWRSIYYRFAYAASDITALYYYNGAWNAPSYQINIANTQGSWLSLDRDLASDYQAAGFGSWSSVSIIIVYMAVRAEDGPNYGDNGNARAFYDNVFLRKYVSPEPSHGSWGIGEELGLSIGSFQAPPTVHADKFFFLNASVNDPDGDLSYATVEISNGIILKWDKSAGFSKQQDTYGYCTLDSSGSIASQLNSTAYKLSWKIQLSCFYPDGNVSILASNTKVVDSYGFTSSNSFSNLFIFICDRPSASLQSPSSGAVFPTAVQCTFVWSFIDKYNASDYQTAFRLQLDDDPDFWTPNIDTGKVASTATNTTIVLPSTSGYYYWRVMVWDSQDFPSEWTAGRLIIIGYKYVLNGAYYENGTKTSFAVTVTAYFEQLQADQFSLNGTVTKLYDKKPTVFVFNFGAASRSWYVRDSVENITVFAPYDTVSLYTFTIQDYAGIIGSNTFFQVDSFINDAFGTMTITRVKATGQVTVPLQVGRSYLLRLVGDGWTYDFKLFVASALTSETLTTKPVFEDRVKLAYKYILADASKDNSAITVKYQDNLKSTLWVYLKIRLTNGTTVYISNVTGLNLVQWVYPLSDNNTLGYWVELTINHASLGSLSYTKALPPAAGRTSPWDLSPLGSFPIPANQVFGVFIVLVFAGLFSTLNAEYGIVLVCMVAGILWLLGWLNIPAAVLAFAMSLAVLYALGRRNIQT
jgi:hypothetical protein